MLSWSGHLDWLGVDHHHFDKSIWWRYSDLYRGERDRKTEAMGVSAFGHWWREEIAVLDVETTGLNVETDRIVSVGFKEKRHIDPGVAVPAAAQRVHRLTNSYLTEHGGDPKEVLRDVSEELGSLAESGTPLVVMNAEFDLTILHREFDRHGVGQPPWDSLVVVDPLILDWRIRPDYTGRRRLVDLYYTWLPDLPVYGEKQFLIERWWHDPLFDASAAKVVLLGMLGRVRGLREIELEELVPLERQWREERSVSRNWANPPGWPVNTPQTSPLQTVLW
jgi:DNA polymerase-3 subunit epsilon